jgi:outer membrane protein assembly factor BamB
MSSAKVRYPIRAAGSGRAHGATPGSLDAAGDQGFYAFDLDGNVLWDVRAVAGDSTSFAGSPAIAPDGTIYTWAGTHVYAIFGTHPPDPTSPWPMWRHDAQRTGRVP